MSRLKGLRDWPTKISKRKIPLIPQSCGRLRLGFWSAGRKNFCFGWFLLIYPVYALIHLVVRQNLCYYSVREDEMKSRSAARFCCYCSTSRAKFEFECGARSSFECWFHSACYSWFVTTTLALWWHFQWNSLNISNFIISELRRIWLKHFFFVYWCLWLGIYSARDWMGSLGLWFVCRLMWAE